MLQTILINVVRILFLIMLQSYVVNRIQLLDGLVLPWVYIFGILMLPFATPRWLVLLVAFLTGLIMDKFTGPMGLHTAACVLLGFMQPLVQQFLAPREGYEITQRPTIQKMGLAWYATYAGVLTLIHHSYLFIMEQLSLSGFFYLMFHILLSVLGTMVCMIIGQFLIYKSKSAEQ
jgi:hypothetical protein